KIKIQCRSFILEFNFALKVFLFFYKMFKKGVDTSVFDVYNGGKWCGSGAEMAESVEKLWQCMENLRIEWMIRGGLFFLFPCVRFSEISSLLQKA
ncbi:MAG TPA: hypothetical protein PLK23_09520, partial [Clostridia bacterium]|nr:hypothetical protein [Clostridia bacterium]